MLLCCRCFPCVWLTTRYSTVERQTWRPRWKNRFSLRFVCFLPYVPTICILLFTLNYNTVAWCMFSSGGWGGLEKHWSSAENCPSSVQRISRGLHGLCSVGDHSRFHSENWPLLLDIFQQWISSRIQSVWESLQRGKCGWMRRRLPLITLKNGKLHAQVSLQIGAIFDKIPPIYVVIVLLSLAILCTIAYNVIFCIGKKLNPDEIRQVSDVLMRPLSPALASDVWIPNRDMK